MPAQVEGAERVEALVQRAVEVGAAGRAQPQLGGELDEQRRLRAAVRDVEGLDAVHARGGEARQRQADVLVGVDVPVGVRPDGQAARRVDHRDRLVDRRRGPPAVARCAGQQVGLEHRARIAEPLAAQARRVRRMVEHGLRDVRAPDRPGGRRGLRELERQALVAQRIGHPQRAGVAVDAPGGERVAQRAVRVVDRVAEDVQVVVPAVERADLDGRDDRHAVDRGGRLQRLGDAVDGVVVAEREQLDTGRVRTRDDLGRRQRSVRARGVRLQVEGGAGHAGACPTSSRCRRPSPRRWPARPSAGRPCCRPR